jgi:Na+/glutamate symporter
MLKAQSMSCLDTVQMSSIVISIGRQVKTKAKMKLKTKKMKDSVHGGMRMAMVMVMGSEKNRLTDNEKNENKNS